MSREASVLSFSHSCAPVMESVRVRRAEKKKPRDGISHYIRHVLNKAGRAAHPEIMHHRDSILTKPDITLCVHTLRRCRRNERLAFIYDPFVAPRKLT